MKAIELTVDHKAKLLEMCKALFPEYPNLEVRDSMEDFCMKQDNCFIELNETDKRTTNTIIHWFEFCTRYLINAINYPKNTINNNPITDVNFLGYCFDHPVDYLYNKYQSLTIP